MIKLTKSAVTHFKNMLDNSANVEGIKLSVKKSGCSGYSYVLDLANKELSSDLNYQLIELEGVKLFIAKDSISFIEGTEIDYVKDKFSGSIKFRNPNVVGECGCGESFSVKKD